jgi:APA family basic amino acid/polyamine antiporter
VFPAQAARVHAKFRAPTIAILAQTIWSSVLMLSGTLAELVSYTGFALVLFSSLAVLSLFVLRRQEGERPRTFRTWGYPWAPGLFVLMGALMIANEVWRNPRPSLAGLAIILAGVPLYLWLTRRSPTAAA